MRYPALDGLRGIAALSVLISHHTNTTGLLGGHLGGGGGKLGVMLFFCISRFLMNLLYIDKRWNAEAAFEFGRARVARVIPLYLLVVFASFGASLLYGDATLLYLVTSENLVKHLVFHSGISVLWTIPVEVQFYLLFPLFWLIFQRLGPLALLAVMVFATLTVAHLGYPEWPGVVRVCGFFFAGMLVAMTASSDKVPRANWAFIGLAAIYALCFPGVRVALGFDFSNPPEGQVGKALWTMPEYLILMTCFLWACLQSSWAEKLLGSGIMTFYGKISYSLYLLHTPVLLALAKLPWAHHYPVLSLAAVLGCSTLLAWLSYRFVEDPARRIINRARLPRLPQWFVGGPDPKYPSKDNSLHKTRRSLTG